MPRRITHGDAEAVLKPCLKGNAGPRRADRGVDGSEQFITLLGRRGLTGGSPAAILAYSYARPRSVSCSAALISSLQMRYSTSCAPRWPRCPAGLAHWMLPWQFKR